MKVEDKLDFEEILKTAAAFFTAALSGMGVGGGGLLLIYLTLIANETQKTAQLINLMFFLAASSSSVIVHVLRRKLSFKVILFLALGGVFGAFIGSETAGAVNDGILRIILGGFLTLSGVISLFGKGKGDDGGDKTK